MNNPEIVTLKPGTQEHADASFSIDTAVNNPAKKFDYNQLANAYDKAEVGSVLILGESHHLQTSNVITVIVARGLANKTDFTMNKAIRDTNGKRLVREDRNLLMTKLTDTPMQQKNG